MRRSRASSSSPSASTCIEAKTPFASTRGPASRGQTQGTRPPATAGPPLHSRPKAECTTWWPKPERLQRSGRLCCDSRVRRSSLPLPVAPLQHQRQVVHACVCVCVCVRARKTMHSYLILGRGWRHEAIHSVSCARAFSLSLSLSLCAWLNPPFFFFACVSNNKHAGAL